MSHTNNVYLQELQCGMFKNVEASSPSQEALATIDNDSVVPTSPDDSVAMHENDKERPLQKPDDDSEVQVFPLADQGLCSAGCALVQKVELVHQSRRKIQTKTGRTLKMMQKKMKSTQEKSQSLSKDSRKKKKNIKGKKKQDLKIVMRKVQGKEKQQHSERVCHVRLIMTFVVNGGENGLRIIV